MASSPPAVRARRGLLLAAAALIGLTLLAYLPALRGGFVFDDDISVTASRLIRAPDGLARFWFTSQAPDYWPVTESAFWLEWRLWGAQAAGYHAVNLVLHLADVLLLWAALRRLRVPGAWLGALLFALHPVNVASAAWISQLKNLLALFFFLLSILAFLRAGIADDPPLRLRGSPRAGLAYGLSLLAFALAALSKGSVVLLPAALLGIVAWRRRPMRRDALALAPFFILAAAFAALDVWFQTHGSGEVIRQAGAVERLLEAGAAVWFYLGKALLPIRLAFVYPSWRLSPNDVLDWLPLAAVFGLTAALWLGRRRGTRPALFAWAYYVAMLLPALGLADVYFMKYSLVADPYQYLALTGLAALAAAAWAAWRERWRTKGALAARAPFACASAAVLALGGLTWRQSRIYRDGETFYRAAIARNPDAWLAWINLGNGFAGRGQPAEAERCYARALRIDPGLPEAEVDWGEALRDEGRGAESLPHFVRALQLHPGLAAAENDLGIALAEAGRPEEAESHFAAALRRDPGYAEARSNLALILAQSGKTGDAIAQLEQAVRDRPDYARARERLAGLLVSAGRTGEAVALIEEEVRREPDSAEASNNLGVLLASSGRNAEAIAAFEQALRLRPDYAAAENNWGNALQAAGRNAEAAERYRQALRLDPNFADARDNLAALLRAESAGTLKPTPPPP